MPKTVLCRWFAPSHFCQGFCFQRNASTATGSRSSPAFQKGVPEGYTLRFTSVILNSNLRGERGTAGEPGYLLLEGKVAKDGSAKLSVNGVVSSRKYARGVLAHKGEDYSCNVKAEFEETEGTGTRNEGLGIVGRACTFGFVKQAAASQAGGR